MPTQRDYIRQLLTMARNVGTEQLIVQRRESVPHSYPNSSRHSTILVYAVVCVVTCNQHSAGEMIVSCGQAKSK